MKKRIIGGFFLLVVLYAHGSDGTTQEGHILPLLQNVTDIGTSVVVFRTGGSQPGTHKDATVSLRLDEHSRELYMNKIIRDSKDGSVTRVRDPLLCLTDGKIKNMSVDYGEHSRKINETEGTRRFAREVFLTVALPDGTETVLNVKVPAFFRQSPKDIDQLFDTKTPLEPIEWEADERYIDILSAYVVAGQRVVVREEDPFKAFAPVIKNVGHDDSRDGGTPSTGASALAIHKNQSETRPSIWRFFLVCVSALILAQNATLNTA